MNRFLEKFLKIYPDETRLFLSVATLMFVLTAGAMLLGNYSETVFLKRYGVRKLPYIYMVNAIITFFLMNYVVVVLRRMSTIRLLRWIFLICAVSVGSLRFLIAYPSVVYPLYYVFDTQFETLLLMLFWNMCNELFNTRQAKRIFPIIMAADMLGRMSGSALTGPLASLLRIDNLSFVYSGLLTISALMTVHLERRFTIFGSQKLVKEQKRKNSFKDELSSMFTLFGESTLFRILAIVTLMSNLMIPIFNYQFNFVLDKQFGTEGGLISFFGWFRSAFNGISFLLLLVTGRFFAFFGLAIAVLVHPLNYIVVFLAILFHFKLSSVIYGRVSTSVIRSTLNSPSLAAIMGLFPGETGGKVRAILRGTVVRVGILCGSLVLLLTREVLAPNLLSLLGIVFGTVWFGAVYYLRRNYATIVVNMLFQQRVDFDRFADLDLKALFKDSRLSEQLVSRFRQEKGTLSTWYAELIAAAEAPGLVSLVLEELPGKDEITQRELIHFIRPRLSAAHFQHLRTMLDRVNESNRLVLLEAMTHIEHEDKESFFRETYDKSASSPARLVSLLGLLQCSGLKERAAVSKELTRIIAEADTEELPVLMRLLQRSGSEFSGDALMERFHAEQDDDSKAFILRALNRLNVGELNSLVYPIIESSNGRSPLLRRAALESLSVVDEKSLRTAIALLDSRRRGERKLMLRKIGGSSIARAEDLLACMLIAKRDVREGMVEILRARGVSEPELQGFLNKRMADAYRYIFTLVRFRRFRESKERELFEKKLDEDKFELVLSVLYTLELQYRSKELRMIRRMIGSEMTRAGSNAVEALESIVSPRLAQRLIPLIDDIPEEERGRKGKRYFPIDPKPEETITGMVQFVISWGGPLLNELVKVYALRAYPEIDWSDYWKDMVCREMPGLRERMGKPATPSSGVGETGGDMLCLSDRIALIKETPLFSRMKVNELAAVASIAVERENGENETVVIEGDSGGAVFLIVSGIVSVVKNYVEDHPTDLAVMSEGESFGEMALLGGEARSATVITRTPCRFLMLEREELETLIQEFPRISLNMLRVLSGRLRQIHEKIVGKEHLPEPST